MFTDKSYLLPLGFDIIHVNSKQKMLLFQHDFKLWLQILPKYLKTAMLHFYLRLPYLLIRHFLQPKKLIFFLFLHENIHCGYSLEVPQLGTSNKYPQHMFSQRNKKYIYLVPPLV